MPLRKPIQAKIHHHSTPGRLPRPVSQHRVHRRHPLTLKAISQLRNILSRGDLVPPHLGLHGLESRVRSHQPVVLHLRQAQPGQVPRAVAVGVFAHAAVRVAHQVSCDGVVWREAAQLGDELLRGHVVDPCGGHGLLEGFCVVGVAACCGYAFDATEFGEGVDAVGVEGFDELRDGWLGGLRRADRFSM